jgi:hypothetical protein
MKQPSDAAQAYRDALAYNPHYLLSRLHLARLFETSGSLPDARSEMKAFWTEWQRADPDAIETIEARQIMAKLQVPD